jgi:tetratricopeptide (TPR) repeat protein
MPGKPKWLNLSFYLQREPLNVALLLGFTVAFFLAVSGLSRIYHLQQESLANRWSARGVADLNARRFSSAVADFHSALLYSRDNYSYRLNLAEALLGLKRTDEAHAYLINLWGRQPENGLVNLELARIAAEKGETEQALRYYHNAIYTTWPGNQEMEQRNSRLELIAFLLRINARTQAQSELIALSENMGDDASQQARLGGLFVQAQDYEHALAAYRLSLKTDSQSQSALAGAGLAAFELGRYPMAQQYLQAAVTASSGDAPSAALLATTNLVLRMDFYRQQISIAERNRIAVEAFAVAGQRLDSCHIHSNDVASAARLRSLTQVWMKLKPQITESNLRQDSDLIHEAMELVFNIERQTSGVCATTSEADTALLLIAKLHEEN